MELIIKMERITIKIIMTKFLKNPVTIKGMVNNHLAKQITMKKNIFIMTIIIRMSIIRVHKKE